MHNALNIDVMIFIINLVLQVYLTFLTSWVNTRRRRQTDRQTDRQKGGIRSSAIIELQKINKFCFTFL